LAVFMKVTLIPVVNDHPIAEAAAGRALASGSQLDAGQRDW